MYDKIKNPLTGRWVNTKGHLGKNILNKYTKQYGGSPKPKDILAKHQKEKYRKKYENTYQRFPLEDPTGIYVLYKDDTDDNNYKSWKINSVNDKYFDQSSAKKHALACINSTEQLKTKFKKEYEKAIDKTNCEIIKSYVNVCDMNNIGNKTVTVSEKCM